MAKTVVVMLVCDRCAAEGIADSPGEEEVSLSYDGFTYTLDLCAPHAVEFHDTLQTILGWSSQRTRASQGRKRGTSASTTSSSPASSGRPAATRRDPEQLTAIRTWARQNGFQVSDRGRIPAEVEAAYNERSKAK